MKDIDFDELDRAVSSVLNKDATPVDSPKIDDASPEGTAITVSSKSKAAQKKTSPAPSRPAPVVPSRRGRFMDVVHTNPTAAPSLSKHDAPAIEPTPSASKPAVEPDEVEPKATLPIVSEVEHTTEPIAEVDEAAALLGAEPAPVQTVAAQETSEPVSTPDKEKDLPAAEATEDVGDDGNDEPEESQVSPTSLASTVPQTSPFLADTKVEKRPLGGSADSGSEKDDATEEVLTDETVPEVTLPRELEADVRDVEITQSEQEQAIASGSPFAAGVPVAAEPADDGRVEGHPLFDTTTYHEPIIDVSHKGLPGWLKWMLGLAACLIVGAGVGYFLFTAGL